MLIGFWPLQSQEGFIQLAYFSCENRFTEDVLGTKKSYWPKQFLVNLAEKLLANFQTSHCKGIMSGNYGSQGEIPKEYLPKIFLGI